MYIKIKKDHADSVNALLNGVDLGNLQKPKKKILVGDGHVPDQLVFSYCIHYLKEIILLRVNYIHDFNQKTEEEFLKVQNNLKEKINISNKIDLKDIKVCAGIDIAYWEKDNVTFGACSIVIIDFETKQILEKVHSVGKIEVPYAAGFLAFRELPLALKAVENITIEPDIFIFDGNGYLHYNNMGIATHAAFFLNKPTIGVAKTYLKIDKVDFNMPEKEVGAYTDIIIKDKVYGRVVRSSKNVKPIFISCGNNIDLDSCYNITMRLLSKDSRIPIPTRLADLETHILREKYRCE